MTMKKTFAFLCIPAFVLAGCSSGVKETLGLERSAPDEFAVIERAPLTMPPNFNLEPPRPGAPRPQEEMTSTKAKGLVLSSQSSAPKPSDVSASEQALLGKVGAAKADPNIRNELNDPQQPEKKSVAQKFGLSSPESPDKALDPVEESKDLQKKNVKTPTPAPAKTDVKK